MRRFLDTRGVTQTAATAPAFSVLNLPGGDRSLIGLARVSTDGQDAQLQRDALTETGCARIGGGPALERKPAISGWRRVGRGIIYRALQQTP